MPQRVAAEAIIAAAAKKDKCTSIINQGVGILKKLYCSKDEGIRVRALVVRSQSYVPLLLRFVTKITDVSFQGLCKLGSFGGHDASLKPFDEKAQHKLADACRRFLVNASKDKDLRKWAAEGLSYLTLDADIKEELIDDEVAIKALIELAKVCFFFTFLMGFKIKKNSFLGLERGRGFSSYKMSKGAFGYSPVSVIGMMVCN